MNSGGPRRRLDPRVWGRDKDRDWGLARAAGAEAQRPMQLEGGHNTPSRWNTRRTDAEAEPN